MLYECCRTGPAAVLHARVRRPGAGGQAAPLRKRLIANALPKRHLGVSAAPQAVPVRSLAPTAKAGFATTPY